MGLNYQMTLGFRAALSTLRYYQLNLAKEKARLQDEELEVSHEIGDAIRNLEYNYNLAQTNFNRRVATEKQVEAVQAAFEAETVTLDLLLDAQRQRADAEVAYFRTLIDYQRGIAQVHYRKGSILEYDGVYLAEGPWPAKAQFDAHRLARQRDASHYLDYGFTRPDVISRGAYLQNSQRLRQPDRCRCRRKACKTCCRWKMARRIRPPKQVPTPAARTARFRPIGCQRRRRRNAARGARRWPPRGQRRSRPSRRPPPAAARPASRRAKRPSRSVASGTRNNQDISVRAAGRRKAAAASGGTIELRDRRRSGKPRRLTKTGSRVASMNLTRISRLVQLISLLQAGKGQNADELSAQCGVSRRTMFRDLDLLRQAGVPVLFDDDEGCVPHSSTAYFLPPTTFTAEEALAMLLVCYELGADGRCPFTARRGRRRSSSKPCLPASLREQVRSVTAAVQIHLTPTNPLAGAEPVYRQLLHCASHRQAVRIRYNSFADDAEIVTKLSPYRLLFSRHSWYAIGRSSLHREVRTFNVGRIARAGRLLPEQFEVPRHFSIDRYLGNAWHLIPEPGPDVEVRGAVRETGRPQRGRSPLAQDPAASNSCPTAGWNFARPCRA